LVGRLIVVAGTGTGIGKTHFAEALLRAFGAIHSRVVGLKPVETGLREATVSDAERLERASSFHVKQFAYQFGDPVSPHLAARLEGARIDVEALVRSVGRARADADLVLVELAGGLFTPLSSESANVDLARALDPDVVLLIAPDRLGVLHDVLATTRAATASHLRIDGVVLVAPDVPDAATGRNAAELERLGAAPLVTTVARAPVDEIASALRSFAASVA